MASIISSGIGSGLDISGLVQQLVAAEAKPVETRIGQQEARTQAKLSAFGSLKSALSEFRDKLEVMKDLQSFLARKSTSGNEEVFTTSASESAVAARYSVQVEQLAQAHKLTSGAFANSDTVVGTGALTVTVGASTFTVDITDDNSTLAGIRDAINNAGDNPGVSATIVNAEAGSHLILTADDTGSEHTLTITQADGDGGLSVLEYDPENGLTSLTEAAAAMDAVALIDGFEVVSTGNTVSGAIDGVTINLLQAAPGESFELKVENDEEAVRKTINEFVESYNQLNETFDKLTAFDATSQIGGPLLGDATIRGVREQLRREFSNAVKSVELPFSTLREVGIETQLDGKLAVVDTDLSDVLANDFNRLGQLFANPADGFATRLFGVVDGLLATDGILEARTTGLNGQIEGFNEQREALGERLASLETRLLRQFNALDNLIGQLSVTSNFLTEQLASLPKISAGRRRD
ncbi:MAG TPA: flagellar filament capping protein FliD [Woeseiaceae bacterium]|nr:flagellar filament capping protein FliD [Woeseiaceae bacterium]